MEVNLLNILEDSTAALAGAFFAFLFIKLSEVLTNLSKRRNQNYNALFKVDVMTNEIIDDLNGSIYDLEQIITHFENAKKKGMDVYSANKPRALKIDKSIFTDLLNIDFINELFSYFRKIEKHNADIGSINEFHRSVKTARLEGKITSDNYMENMERFVQQLKVFNNFSYDLMDKTAQISASCRVLMDTEQTIRMIIRGKFLIKKYSKKFTSKKQKHLDKLKIEMEEIRKKSREEIDKVLNVE